jgi:peptidyl-prolyl cis-trans isomerase C
LVGGGEAVIIATMNKLSTVLALVVGIAIGGYCVWRFVPGLLPKGAKEPGGPKSADQKQPETKQPDTKSPARTPEPQEPIAARALKDAEADPNVVAAIGEYVITKEELRGRLMMLYEKRPYDYDGLAEKAEPTDANAVLMKIIAEKAMTMDARKQNVLVENEMIRTTVRKFKERKLVGLLMQKQLEGKLSAAVSEAEIAEKISEMADPKLDRERAKMMVERAKANEIMGQYYAEIYKKSNVKKVNANFVKAAQLHQRLLFQPKVERNVRWILNSQMRDELTEDEKNIVLATFEKGEVRVSDWFETLGDIAPPRRPNDLNTAQGVERLLDQTLRTPILVAEAVSLGLDKDEDIRKQVRDWEDMNLPGYAQQTKYQEAPEPTEDEIRAYFDGHKEEFKEDKKLKIEQIWCADLKTAEKAKAELNESKDFNSVRQKYSLEKEGKAFDTKPGTEAYFWPELWEGDPNNVVGPLKGMYGDGFKWRIVKILEKNQGTTPEFSEAANRAKLAVLTQRRLALMEKYCKELLGKYSYKVYAERIKDINPLDIP